MSNLIIYTWLLGHLLFESMIIKFYLCAECLRGPILTIFFVLSRWEKKENYRANLNDLPNNVFKVISQPWWRLQLFLKQLKYVSHLEISDNMMIISCQNVLWSINVPFEKGKGLKRQLGLYSGFGRFFCDFWARPLNMSKINFKDFASILLPRNCLSSYLLN